MTNDLKINADRFAGFGEIYDNARPQCPDKVVEIILKYLGKQPGLVVDMGCGTGLSTRIWSNISAQVIGIEPSTDMLHIAKIKSELTENVQFIQAFSDQTGLEDGVADVITCSQSFHWMNPVTTLTEVDRLLKDKGIFAVYDCDWPPVIHWEVEKEFNALFEIVKKYEQEDPKIGKSFVYWPKENHLDHMNDSGIFRYTREIVFSNSEQCDANRFIAIALSQGGLQSVLKSGNAAFEADVEAFKKRIYEILGDEGYMMDFCYRLRIGVK